MKQTQAQAWQSPDHEAPLKVDYINNVKRVTEFPSGPERTNINEMRATGWAHLGAWVDSENIRKFLGVQTE